MEEDINKKLFEIYTLVELSYEKQFKETVSDVEDLYPIKWYGIKNYKKKIDILSEALEKNILLKDTNGYKEFDECIKRV